MNEFEQHVYLIKSDFVSGYIVVQSEMEFRSKLILVDFFPRNMSSKIEVLISGLPSNVLLCLEKYIFHVVLLNSVL